MNVTSHPVVGQNEPGVHLSRIAPSQLLDHASWLLFIDIPHAGELGRQVLDATADQPTLALRGDAWFHVGYALLRAGADVAPAIAANEQARACYAAHDDARGLLMCDEFDALRLRAEGRLHDALELHLRIAARIDVERPPTDLYISHNSRALTRRRLGQSDAMLLDFYQALEASQSCDSPGPNINALVNLGASHAGLYNLTEAQRLSEQALDLAEECGAWISFCSAALTLTQCCDGLGQSERCAVVLERLRAHEADMPPGTLRHHTASMAAAHLCAGDLEGTRAWLDLGAAAPFARGDGKTDFARVHACYLMATGRPAEAREVAQARIEACAHEEFHDQPYARMRLLQAATEACECLGDTAAALRLLREAHALYVTLVGRSSRAGFIASQAAHEYAQARLDRDRAREAQERAEADRRRLAALNGALQARVHETQRLNDALREKIAEAQALEERLRELTVRDPLTGLYNRRFLAETSVARIDLARRQDKTIAIVLLDVDHFKQINDAFGHARGDDVLQQFAELLKRRMRRSDVICRFGGEEFVLLVDDCDEKTLLEILHGLMGQFRQMRFGSAPDTVEGRTFSAGVAMLDVDGADFESLVRVADERMYRAKATGRARIVTI